MLVIDFFYIMYNVRPDSVHVPHDVTTVKSCATCKYVCSKSYMLARLKTHPVHSVQVAARDIRVYSQILHLITAVREHLLLK
jgi:hypothetical protein